ncbi:MAG: DUF3253 domain-containing protein [Verrucomicrobiota bacterium]
MARQLDAKEWRELMEPVRVACRELARRGKIRVSQKGKFLDPDANWKGPIRISISLD